MTPLPPPENSSGAWILTSACFSGIVIFVLHFGHGPVLPANLSSNIEALLAAGTYNQDRHVLTRQRGAVHGVVL